MSHNKWPKVYGFIVHLLCFQKHGSFYTFCSVFGTLTSPLPFPTLFTLPNPCFYKPYLQSNTFLNIRDILSSVVFCSNAVLIITPSSSMELFSFFDVLHSVLTATGMTLMLLMFHILLISLFSFWYLSIFSFSFLLTLMSPGIAISIMTQLFLFLFTTTIFGFLALISL